MNQRFFASLTGKYLRVLALLFVLFGAAQQLSAQSLVSPSVAAGRVKEEYHFVENDLRDPVGTETQIGLQRLRFAYLGFVASRLDGTLTTQQVLDKASLLLVEAYTKLPQTNITMTSAHVQSVVSQTTTLLSN
ncbi:MAG: hypothetical protein JNM22_15600 [Saprospiraceae bacterium]|nr:hypothetical protein [Saprospiraceae bacterium]